MATTSITFRVDNDRILFLKKLADEEGTTLNALVNTILKSYLEWEFISAKAGFAPTQKCVLRALFEKMTEQELNELAIKAANDFRDRVLLTYGKIDLDTILSLTSIRAKRSGFVLREFIDEGPTPATGATINSNCLSRRWVL